MSPKQINNKTIKINVSISDKLVKWFKSDKRNHFFCLWYKERVWLSTDIYVWYHSAFQAPSILYSQVLVIHLQDPSRLLPLFNFPFFPCTMLGPRMFRNWPFSLYESKDFTLCSHQLHYSPLLFQRLLQTLLYMFSLHHFLSALNSPRRLWMISVSYLQ